MQAVLVSIGDEILNGTTINTNASTIASKLQEIGIDTHEIIAIRDRSDHILETIAGYLGKTDLIITTGGLGPTKDDITKNTLCTVFNSDLVFHEDIYERLRAAFAKRNIPFTGNNRDQAMYPHNCTVLNNNLGTAQGMWFEKDGTVLVSLPGVPFEMKGLMETEVIPRLLETGNLPHIINRYFMTGGISESYLAGKLEAFEHTLPKHISLAYLPSPGVVKLRLTAKTRDPQKVAHEIEQLAGQVHAILGDSIYADAPMMPEEFIGKQLIQLGASLATAESCTGGKLAHKITSVQGSSVYFKGGIISYANVVKEELLHVPTAILDEQGAVSEETVSYMLDGAMRALHADFAMAVSGIAGPEGGSDEKPVGTIWIGVAGKGQKRVKHYFFNKNREINIEYACMFALHELRLLLADCLVKPA